jgi:hypothetical protein
MSGTNTGFDEDADVHVKDLEQLGSRNSTMSEDDDSLFYDDEEQLNSRNSITDTGPGTRLDICVDNLREELKTCLSISTARSQSTFMHQDTHDRYPNPGLKIRDFHNVSLPLSPQNIDTIKQVGHRSPSGRHTETTIGVNVKEPWQMKAADLVCSYPPWKSWIDQDVLPKCLDALGVSPLMKNYVRAELHMMSLYEEGAHFEPSQATEKALGIFATLAICLPSEHHGGDLVVKHNEKCNTWSSSKSSAFGLSFSAWYAKLITRLFCPYAHKQ